MLEAGDGATASCSGATARRRASSSTSRTPRRGASLLAAERYDGAEPVNIGTGVEISIRELAETIAELTGFEGEIVWDTSMPNGQPTRCLDVSRAREGLGFEAEMPLVEGLRRTLESFRADAAAVTS